MQEKAGHMGGLSRTAVAKRELNELCRDLVGREIEKGRLQRPLSLRRLRRWVAKQVVRRVGLRGEHLKTRWRHAAIAAILMSGMVLSFGTEARAAAKMVNQSSWQGIQVSRYSKITYADMDGDGDLDAFVGNIDGTIQYYVNNGTGVFTEQTGAWDPAAKTGNPFDGIDVGYNSAPAFADIDGDGDLDAFIGERYGTIKYYVNNGTGVFTEQTGAWDPGTKAGNPFDGVNAYSHSTPAFADIDGDGDLDAFAGNVYGTIRYYVNDGTGVFTEQTGAWDPGTKAGNPFNAVDAGYVSAPAFADIDGDGDLDALVGEYYGSIKYYVNNGTGVFTEQTGAWDPGTKAGNPFNGVDAGYFSAPAFADIDGDGDLDAFIGEWFGTISYYINDGTGVFTDQAVWNPVAKTGNPFNGITVNYGYSAPTFADIDGDGDLDAFVGEYYGTIKYYVNDGTGVFTEQTGDWDPSTKAGNPFNGIGAGYYSAPAFADIDGDGDLDAFIGNQNGSITYFINDGTGVFTEQTGAWDPVSKTGNPFDGVNAYSRSTPAFADIDGDGDLDAFVGEYYGTIRYYVNDGTGVFTEQTGAWDPGTKAGNPFDGISVGYNSTPAFADIDGDGDLDAFVGEYYGTIRYYVNDGTGVFTEQTGAWVPSAMPPTGNPFNGITVNSGYSTPAFADIDGDGDLDAFIGDRDGKITYFKNMNRAPVFTGTPSIDGTGAVGSILSLVNTAAADADGDMVTLSYQWKADNVAITLATSSTFTITTAGAHKTITCTVTANDGWHGKGSATSAGVVVANAAPAFTGTPAISGTGAVGSILSLVNTAATDADGDTVTLSYQWKADGVTIAGATSSTFTVTTAEANKIITCVVTASDGNGGATPATTAGITVKTPGDYNNDGIVNVADALRALRIAAGLISQTPTDLVALDLAPLVNNAPNPDGKIELGDVVVILRKAVGLW